MQLHVYKSSPRHTHPYIHPSALWAVAEIPGLMLAREWMPEMHHHDWIVLFDEYLQDRPSGESLLGPDELYLADKLYQAMKDQRFATRREALRALSASLIIHT